MAVIDDYRASWRARPSSGALTRVSARNRTEHFTHWNGPAVGLLGKPHTACLDAVRADQRYHIESNGWSDIGYNALVCPHARVIEGRGLDYVGAHCPNHNTSGYGIQLMIGKGETATPAMLARARRLYGDLCERSGRALAKRSHRDAFATDCPGEQLARWVKAGMPVDLPNTPPQEDDEMAPSVLEIWTTDLTTKGTLAPIEQGESPLDILARVGRNTEAIVALVKGSAADVAAAVVAALPADAPVDVDQLARAIVVELGKDAAS